MGHARSGAKLAARVRAAGLSVVPVVGASAVMGALSVAGVSEPNFYFHGFLPAKAGERQKLLATWAEATYPIVMFETPHRIAATLADMAAVFPQRSLVLAREISKTFETTVIATFIKHKMINAILVVLLVLIGGVPSILLTLSVPVMLIWKIYRKVRYGYSLYQ